MKIVSYIYMFVCLGMISCSNDFLDVKPDKALVVPKTLADYQALLDDVAQQMNQTPGLINAATDEFIAKDNSLQSSASYLSDAYLWDYEGLQQMEIDFDWTNIYAQVLKTNLVLEGLDDMKDVSDKTRYNDVKGSALFLRAWHFFHLLQVYAVPYDRETANADLGIVLKLKADINDKVGRSTVDVCYNQIIQDLLTATELLSKTSIVISRPSRCAAYALLARVYLSRFDYENAEKYASLSLQLQPDLLDYNLVGNTFEDPFRVKNPEIIFYSMPILQASQLYTNGIVNPAWISIYTAEDLRKSKYFKFDGQGNAQMKATYYFRSLVPFTGLTTSEMYLIQAECLIRRNSIPAGLALLNHLRKHRFNKEASIMMLEAEDMGDAMTIVLDERIRELVFRGLRWFDLRRLNKDPRFKVALERVYNGNTYRLEPNDKMYCFPIPRTEKMYNNLIE